MWVESDLLRHKGIYIDKEKLPNKKERKRTACFQCAPRGHRAGIMDCVIKKVAKLHRYKKKKEKEVFGRHPSSVYNVRNNNI